METKLYDMLGLEKDATTQDIKHAFKKLAMQHHPDRGGDENIFKEIGRAYDVLSNDEKRKIYDKLGEKGLENIEQESNQPDARELFNDIFASHTNSVKYNLIVSLKDLYLQSKMLFKYNRSYPCTECEGCGHNVGNAADKYKCQDCDNGIKTTVIQMGHLIQQMRGTCNECRGTGKNIPKDECCKECNGDGKIDEKMEFELELKNSMCSKMQLNIKNKGHIDKNGNIGDLVIILQEEQHPLFRRNGNDLIYRKTITLADALLHNTKFVIDFIDDKPLLIKSRIVIEPYKTYKLIGMGMDKKSDMFIEFNIKFPSKNEIKPEFKKHLKKYLKYIDEEIDTTGLKSSSLIEMDKEENEEYQDSMPFMGGSVPLMAGMGGAPAQCEHQ